MACWKSDDMEWFWNWELSNSAIYSSLAHNIYIWPQKVWDTIVSKFPTSISMIPHCLTQRYSAKVNWLSATKGKCYDTSTSTSSIWKQRIPTHKETVHTQVKEDTGKSGQKLHCCLPFLDFLNLRKGGATTMISTFGSFKKFSRLPNSTSYKCLWTNFLPTLYQTSCFYLTHILPYSRPYAQVT